MIDVIEGRVAKIAGDSAVVMVGGIGFKVAMPTPDLARIGDESLVYTHLDVKADDLKLYGFLTERGREVFRMLITVQGVGPKVALAVMGFHPNDALQRHIAGGDKGALTMVPGVGSKSAERIILDLRDKMGVGAVAESAPTGSALAEVREALKGLGYTQQEAGAAMADLPDDCQDTATLLRFALRTLGSRDKASANGHGPA